MMSTEGMSTEQISPPIATEVDHSIVVAQNVKEIPRLYHYAGDVLVFNELFGGGGFATLLNRIHGFIDCIHDQFDPQRKNIFFSTAKGKDEDNALKKRIWEYFIGPNQNFYANGKSYSYNTGIHTLAHALEIEDSAQDTGIKLNITGTEVTNDDRMPFKCKKWSDSVTSLTAKIDPMTVYKFTDYNPQSGGSGVFGNQLKQKYLKDNTNPNKYYIHDCGSKSFHDAFVEQTDGKSISFFSGILDSSTTNDDVPVVSPENINKLQFEIPYLYIPGGGRINVHCTFDKNGSTVDTKTLVLTFKLLDANGNPVSLNGSIVSPSVFVESKNVPSLPDVSEFLSGKLGCINAIKRMVTGKNPCIYLKDNLQELFEFFPNNKEFEQMFMIAFKHMGDKIRLIDAIIANNVLSNGKCHTATIDTFSNRYAISGNLHTILPIKTGHYIYVNNYHSIDEKMIELMKIEQKKRDKETNMALCAQIQMLVDNETSLFGITYPLIEKFVNIFETFKGNCNLKKSSMMRRCLSVQYWEVKLPPENVHAKFLNGTYDKDDNAKINTAYTLIKGLLDDLNKYSTLSNFGLDDMNYICKKEEEKEKNGEEAYVTFHPNLKPNLNLLLDLYGMYTKIFTFNIGISGDTIINNDRKTMNLKLFASIMSKCKFGGAFTNGKQDVRSKVQSGGGELWDIDGELEEFYSEEEIKKDFAYFEITEQNGNNIEKDREDKGEAINERRSRQGPGPITGQKRSIDDNCIHYENMKDVISIGCNNPKKVKGSQRGGDDDTGAKLLISFLKLQHEAHEKYQKLYEEYENFLEGEIPGEFSFDEKNKAVEAAFKSVEDAADEVEKHFDAREATRKAAAEEATKKAAAEEAARKAAAEEALATKSNNTPLVFFDKYNFWKQPSNQNNPINNSDSLVSYSSESDRSESDLRNDYYSDTADSLDNTYNTYLNYNNPNRKRDRKSYSTVSHLHLLLNNDHRRHLV